MKQPPRLIQRALLCMHALVWVPALVLLLSGCTFARYSDGQGRSFTLLDIRLAGSAVDAEITRPDGTKVTISREQETPEKTIEAIGEAIPQPRIIP